MNGSVNRAVALVVVALAFAGCGFALAVTLTVAGSAHDLWFDEVVADVAPIGCLP
jgi:hypothetical protein